MKDPIIIGSMGGSGTRVFAQILKDAGCFIGKHLNISNDSLDFYIFHRKWMKPIILKQNCYKDKIEKDFQFFLKNHNPENIEPWAFKEPNSIYLLEFLHNKFKNMRFIHVIRDGRDMAFSSNKNQLKNYGSLFFNIEVNLSENIKNAILWDIINSNALRYAYTHNLNYCLIKFEDLCNFPKETIKKICDFTKLKFKKDLIDLVKKPKTIGRYKKANEYEMLFINKCIGSTLNNLNYT